MVQNAKIFRNGSSQAVRLPKEFRFEGEEVCIKRVAAAVSFSCAWDNPNMQVGQDVI